MRKIPLTQGQYALVDDEDYEYLMQWKWCAMKRKRDFIAVRNRSWKEEPGAQLILMHRVIMSAPKEMEVDHRNHNGLDNQKGSLRICTHMENRRNTKMVSKGASQFKGVVWSKWNKKWQAQLCYSNKCIFLGLFDIEEEAARAYDTAAHEHFGEFAYLNFPEEVVVCEKC